MTNVVRLTFNPFQENTYIIYDETKECVLIDPGCSNAAERKELERSIEELGLNPVRLLNTHCHIDHVLGNAFAAKHYQLPLEIHEREIPVLDSLMQTAYYFGVTIEEPSPAPGRFIEEDEVISFGQTRLEVLFTPGHSPGSISFYCRESRFIIAGDVLFQGSIGRTDLPGGDYDILINSIKTQLLKLEDNVKVYPGHGPATTIGGERRSNPFLV
ncbi:MAG: MBL fold metallo-hydrolase [Saprospiraceae bacterium]|nr:MBL fold metallo-hydrolase [Saprospiraceae bacterium]